MTSGKKKTTALTGLGFAELFMIKCALTIAFEDGSIYGGSDDNNDKVAEINERGEKLHTQLDTAIKKVKK